MTGTKEPHLHGPLFLLFVLPLAALPWTPFAAVGAWIVARRARVAREDRFGLGAALGAILLPLLLLSIPASKRETYLIPLLPAAAALAAWVLHRAPAGRVVHAGVRSLIGGLALMGVVALLVPVFAPVLGPRLHATDRFDAVTSEVFTRGPIVVACVAVGLASLAAAWYVARARVEPVRAARRTATSIAVLAVGGAFAFLPTFDPVASLADAVVIARREAPGASFHVAGTSDPSSLWAFGFHRTGYVGDHAKLASTLAPDAPRALVLAKGGFWTRRAALASPESLALVDRARVLWERRVGTATWHLLTNAPP